MTELQPSLNVYHIAETDGVFTVRCNKPIRLMDAFFTLLYP